MHYIVLITTIIYSIGRRNLPACGYKKLANLREHFVKISDSLFSEIMHKKTL